MNAHPLIQRLSDYLKIAGIIVGLIAPCVTFYTVTRVQLAQQEIRINQLEKRADKVDQILEQKVSALVHKIDQQTEKIAAMQASIARLETRR